MASYDMTYMTTSTITAEMIADKFPNDAFLVDGQLIVFGRKGEEKVCRWIEDQAAPAPQAAPAAAGITEKQMDFMLRLIAQDRHEGCFMVIPTSREAIMALSKRDASAYISAMLEN